MELNKDQITQENNSLRKRLKMLWLFILGIRNLMLNRPLICVYQLGKVGSQSIERALQEAFSEDQIVFYHLQWRLKHAYLTKYWLLRLYQITKRKIIIVSPIREPIARNISSFTHDFREFCYQNGLFENRKTMHEVELDKIYEIFFHHYDRHDFVNTWFQEELYKYTGIDVYAEPFDKGKGFQTYSKDHIQLLVFQSECSDPIKEKMISEFLNRPVKIKERINTFKDRPYKAHYAELKSKILSNQEYIDRMQSGIFYQHFYA